MSFFIVKTLGLLLISSAILMTKIERANKVIAACLFGLRKTADGCIHTTKRVAY